MLEQYVHTVVNRKIRQEYPHIELPSAVFAQITKARTDGSGYVYNVKILDANRNVDERFPEIPNVRSELALDPDDIVAALLLYGQLNLFIVGKVI